MSMVARPPTMADLLEQLGGISPERVRLDVAPGKATVKDVIRILDHENRPCELVDGVLVEKAMGFYEARLAGVMVYFLEGFAGERDLGIVIPPDGPLRLLLNLVRLPDVSFIGWAKLPNREIPAVRVPALVPDLAVEVISEGNTPKEMDRKLREYFKAGVPLVWYVYPATRSVKVFTAVDQVTTLHETDTLDGGAVLPGFRVGVKQLFERAGRPQARPRSRGRSKPADAPKPRRKRKGR